MTAEAIFFFSAPGRGCIVLPDYSIAINKCLLFSVNSTLSDVPHYNEADRQAAFGPHVNHVTTSQIEVLNSRME